MKRKNNKMVLKLLWYYLAILIIPTITTTIIYVTAREALLDVQKEKANVALNDSVNQFERDIVGVCNVATYLGSDRKIIGLAQNSNEEKSDAYYEMFKCCDEFPKYTLTNSMIEDICIWFRNQPYIMSVPGVYPKTERSISSIASFKGSSVEELEQEFLGTYHYMSMYAGKDNGLNTAPIRIVRSLSSRNGEHYDGVVAISLNSNVLNTLLKNNRIDSADSVFLLDDKGMIIRAFTDNGYEIKSSGEISWNEYVEKSDINKGSYTYKRTSEYTGWQIVAVTPEVELTEKIGGVKFFMGSLYLLSLLAGGFICLYYWYHNKKMVDRYCEFAKNLSSEGVQENQNQGFWKSFGSFLEQIENLQKDYNKQEVLLEGECIYKLLLGKYRSLDELEKENKKIAAHLLEQKGFAVAVIRLGNQMSEGFAGNENEISKNMETLFLENISCAHRLYAMDNQTYALLLYVESEDMLSLVREDLAGASMRAEESRMLFFVGISRYTDQIMELHGAYEAAGEICKSASFFQIHRPLMETERTNQIQGQIMSLEKEYQMEQIMLGGTENDLEAMLLQIREVNIDQISQRYWLLHMTNTIQSVLIRCLKKTPDDWSRDMIAKVQKAEWPDELFFLLRMAKHHQISMKESKNSKHLQQMKEKLETKILAEYPNEGLNLALLAEQMEMSEQKLYREFKLCFGVTFSEYLENVRIAKACSLLKAGTAVKDVAGQIGYNSDYSFRRAFKRKTEMTPSAYMKTL